MAFPDGGLPISERANSGRFSTRLGDEVLDQARELRVRVAGSIRGRIDEVVDAMVSGYCSEIDAYAVLDAETLTEVRAKTHMNVELLSHVLEVEGDLTDEILEVLGTLGRQRAAEGFPLHAVLRAYQVGIAMAWRYILEEIEEQGASPELASATIASVSQSILRITGQISSAVYEAYLETERAKATAADRLRQEVFDQLLSGTSGDLEGLAERATQVGYGLGDAHSVLVVGIEGTGTREQAAVAARAAARALAGRVSEIDDLGPCTPLVDTRGSEVLGIVPVSAGTSLVDVRGRLSSELDRVRSGADLTAIGGLGTVEAGLSGIATSYHQALEARAAARALGAAVSIATYPDMVPALLLQRNHELAVSLHRQTIEPIARWDAENDDRLLETLTVFLEEGQHHKRTADRLFIHRHTLPPRLAKIERLTGCKVTNPEGRLLLALGLLAQRIFAAGGTREDISDTHSGGSSR